MIPAFIIDYKTLNSFENFSGLNNLTRHDNITGLNNLKSLVCLWR